MSTVKDFPTEECIDQFDCEVEVCNECGAKTYASHWTPCCNCADIHICCTCVCNGYKLKPCPFCDCEDWVR